jgi:hypothetical protein
MLPVGYPHLPVDGGKGVGKGWGGKRHIRYHAPRRAEVKGAGRSFLLLIMDTTIFQRWIIFGWLSQLAFLFFSFIIRRKRSSRASERTSDLRSQVTETPHGFHVEAYVRISYELIFVEDVFSAQNPRLADLYRRWDRCLALIDVNVYELYGRKIDNYFETHGIKLTVCKTKIGEHEKSVGTALSISEVMIEFGLSRREPVLVVGGGVITDVGG